MQFLDWQSDGIPAMIALVLYGLILLTFTIRGARRSPTLARLMPAALAWHLVVFAFIAFWLLPHYAATEQADASTYHNGGMEVAGLIHARDWDSISIGLGSDTIPFITGLLYAPLGGDVYGALFFSAVLGFCGCLWLCRAFSLWTTPHHLKRYASIILFLPSFATWTSIFGKDSWIALGIGLAVYGYSSMLRARTWTGLPYFGIGFGITTVIRPHIAVILAASMVLAYALGLTQRGRGSLLAKGTIAIILVSGSYGLVQVASSFIGVKDFSASSLEQYTAQRSAGNLEGGGSDVDVQATPGIRGALLAFPRGVVRVLLQPFPWEIRGINTGLAAVENIFILGYLIINIKRLGALLRGIAKEPYLLFSAAFSCLILLMLSLTPNLGLISRQRAQMLPFLFAVLVATRKARVPRPVAVSAPNRSQYMSAGFPQFPDERRPLPSAAVRR